MVLLTSVLRTLFKKLTKEVISLKSSIHTIQNRMVKMTNPLDKP